MPAKFRPQPDGVVVTDDLGTADPASPSERLALSGRMLSVGEVRLLRDLVRDLEPGSIVINIGAGAGTSACAFFESNPNLVVYSVDVSAANLAAERNALWAAGLPLANQIRGDSARIGREWDLGDVALLFVDGDHTARAVIADIVTWFQHVPVGGVVVFHDYGVGHRGWEDVHAVVDAWSDALGDGLSLAGRERLLIAFRREK